MVILESPKKYIFVTLCEFVKIVNNILENPRRIEILNLLNEEKDLEFKEILEKTNYSRSSTYNHLKILEEYDLITKTDSRPTKYKLSDFTLKLLELTKDEKHDLLKKSAMDKIKENSTAHA